MLSTVFKGILIGVIISAPMGPIGLLCIQRTLNKGRWHGFATGGGAVLSDLFYATLTGLSMGFVVDFIQKNQSLLQIIGSLLLMAFGYYTFRSNPTKKLKKPDEPIPNTYTQDAITSFFLTLSNPFIIFLLLGLYARFSFISQEETIFALISGLLGIALGAMLWWFLITFFVGKLRSTFNVRGMWVLNRIVGSIIMIFAVMGFLFSIFESGN
ncbi:MAG: LysE family transporter [Dysgonamonadaceae bacterium]|jgi:threonine/homoserine/homoserine lactone efflux protein|nr:LysE family transporter [Dysgonamonadaceae bacterium]